MGKWVHRLLSKDLVTRLGVCAACGPVTLAPVGGGKLRCSVAVRADDRARRQPHGLTKGEAREACQGKACALCGTTDDLVIDHDHLTGRRRAVLCRRHNAGLGMFGDDPVLLRLAASYVDTWSAVDER